MRVARIKPVPPPDATLQLPGSKSLTNRALIIAALADGESVLLNASRSDDSTLLCRALRQIGVLVRDDDHRLTVGGRPRHPADGGTFFFGNAGTAIRFFTAYLCLQNGTYITDGDERMQKRPIQGLVDALNALGADVHCVHPTGCPPVRIVARGLRGGRAQVPADISSQFISALLMIAPGTREGVQLELAGPVTSEPYIQLTVGVMNAFGVSVQNEQSRRMTVRPAPYRPCTFFVEPDAAGANYFLALAAAARGRVTIENLGTRSPQGELEFAKVLAKMGCRVVMDEHRTTVEGAPLKGVAVDLNRAPDSVQTLAVLALFAEGPTEIRNVRNLRLKETDRIAALAKELRKMGARVEELEDGLRIEPPARPTPARIESYNDHRMVMSFAVAAAAVPGMELDNPACVSKSFPEFWEVLRSLGAEVALE